MLIMPSHQKVPLWTLNIYIFFNFPNWLYFYFTWRSRDYEMSTLRDCLTTNYIHQGIASNITIIYIKFTSDSTLIWNNNLHGIEMLKKQQLEIKIIATYWKQLFG